MPAKWGLCFGVFGALLIVALPVFWFAELPSSAHGHVVCTTPSIAMTQAIDTRMRDRRVVVSHVRIAPAHDREHGSLFFVSAQVRADGIFVGFGTWAANFSDPGPPDGPFGGWSREPASDSLVPVNDLARTLSKGRGPLRSPGMMSAALAAQRCAGWRSAS